jgi:hypothetical protein
VRVSILKYKNLVMKKNLLSIGSALLLFIFSASAQQPAAPAENKNPYNPANNPTVAAINANYVIAPVKSEPLTNEKIFPVIGKYNVTAHAEETAMPVTIMLDEQNRGIAWLDGLQQGKIKLLLKRSPAVYKIPAQKTDLGKDVAEGTLIYDKESNQLNICIGKSFNDAEPGSVFAAVTEEMPAADDTKAVAKKAKVKVVKVKAIMLSGSKVDETTASAATTTTEVKQ